MFNSNCLKHITFHPDQFRSVRENEANRLCFLLTSWPSAPCWPHDPLLPADLMTLCSLLTSWPSAPCWPHDPLLPADLMTLCFLLTSWPSAPCWPHDPLLPADLMTLCQSQGKWKWIKWLMSVLPLSRAGMSEFKKLAYNALIQAFARKGGQADGKRLTGELATHTKIIIT